MAKKRKNSADKRKLSGSEQKLKAAIQQLRASEQQLKAANQQLRASEQQFKAANQQLQAEVTERKKAEAERSIAYDSLNSSVNGVIIADLEGGITYVNPAALRMFEYQTAEQIKGKLASQLFVTDKVQKFADVTAIIDHVKDQTEEFRVRRKDGFEFDVEVSSSVVTDEKGTVVGRMASFVDITERKKGREQLSRQTAVLDAINKVFHGALTCETEEKLGKTCLAVAEELTGSKFGFIGELNQAGSYDTIAISNPGWDACKMPKSEATRLLINMPLRGIWARPLKDGKSLMLTDPSFHLDSVGTPEGHPLITFFLGVPLKHKGRTFGMFALGNKEGGYDVADKEAAESLSVVIVEALRHKRAADELGKHQERLEELVNERTITLQKEVDERKKVEEELLATNQQLRASEQQLKAANQQLKAEVTERKQAEAKIKASLREKEVLLKEIHHRVKNNMQVISSVLNLQSKQIKNKHALKMFEDSQNRIKSMALVHEKLYESENLARIDFAEYTRSMTSYLFSLYRIGPAIGLNIDIKDFLLDVNTAIPCGLIINELVSNSLKYAFPEGIEGEICIQLSSDKDGKVTLIVDDNGIGFPKDLDFRKTESLGMQLIIMLVEQLEGTVELDKSKGTTFTITFSKPKPKDGEPIKWQV